jgi:hypothetical protein
MVRKIIHLQLKTTYLRICETELGCSHNAKDTEYDEQTVADFSESRKDEKPNCWLSLTKAISQNYQLTKIEPVSFSGDSHAPGSGLERPDFGCIDPANRRERKGTDNDQKVRECDNGVRW